MRSRYHLVDIARELIGVSPVNRVDELDLITENRWREIVNGVRYSWCGDFATYCLMMAGCQDGGALNRVALNGSWKAGDNIARLWRWARDHECLIPASDVDAGDVVVWERPNGDHICIASGPYDQERRMIHSIDGNSTNGAVAARSRVISGENRIRWCMNVSSLLQQNVAADEGYFPFPVPDISIAHVGRLPFPAGWFFSLGDSGPRWSACPAWSRSSSHVEATTTGGLFDPALAREARKGLVLAAPSLLSFACSIINERAHSEKVAETSVSQSIFEVMKLSNDAFKLFAIVRGLIASPSYVDGIQENDHE